MTDEQESPQPPIIASLVAENDRMDFFPAFFGPGLMMRGEAFVYDGMSRICPKYNGGYWDFYTLSNGGHYLALANNTMMRVEIIGNGFGGELSADAAGIVSTLAGLTRLCFYAENTPYHDSLIDQYYFLTDFGGEHKEAENIFLATD